MQPLASSDVESSRGGVCPRFAKKGRLRLEADLHEVDAVKSDPFRLLVQSIVDYAIYMLDPKGFVTSWNAGAERIKGFQTEEIVGKHFSTFYTEEDREAGMPRKVLETARCEGKYSGEGWRVRKDGSRFWASVVVDRINDEKGKLIGFAKITRDMTEQREAQQALLEAEQKFRMLVQGVTDYAIFMLDPEGRVTNWNAGAQRIKGYLPDEIVGEHFGRFYSREDFDAGVPHRALETARETGRYEAEGWRIRKDGTRFWASVVLDAIEDDDGKLIGFAKITRDMTEKREAQLRLEESRGAIVPVAEDGSARSTDRRPRARLQQSADGDPRRVRAGSEEHQRRKEGAADARGRARLGAAGRQPHKAAARLRPSPAARDQAYRPSAILR